MRMASDTSRCATGEGGAGEKKPDVLDPASEMDINVSLDQLSYICEYCGKVNAISSPRCARCGKRRPRSEYLSAMEKVRNAKSVKAEYLEERAKLEIERKNRAEDQLVRLVEERVADERAQIKAQAVAELDLDREIIKRNTARDAVMRIIEAERRAEAKVKNAEDRMNDAIAGRERETAERIESERERVLYAAARRMVSERKGIEDATEARIAAEKREVEHKARETLFDAVDDAEKSAARRAAMQIIASEQASADRARLERDAISRAALDRVEEERRLAEVNAYAKYKVQKEAVERATDERIRAEREMLYGRRATAYAGARGGAGNVQPLTIVPYVNSRQPLYQYGQGRTVFRFVPDVEAPNRAPAEIGAPGRTAGGEKTEAKKAKAASGAARALSIVGFVLFVAATLTAFLSESLNFLRYVEGQDNFESLKGLFSSGAANSEHFVFNVCVAAMAAFSAISAIFCLIGIFAGRANAFGLACAALATAGAAAMPVILLLKHKASFSFGMILPCALCAVALILTICAFASSRARDPRPKPAKAKRP